MKKGVKSWMWSGLKYGNWFLGYPQVNKEIVKILCSVLPTSI